VSPGGIPDSVLLETVECPRQFDPDRAVGVIEVKTTSETTDYASENQTMIYHAALLESRKGRDAGLPCLAITTDVDTWVFAIADEFVPSNKFAVAMATRTGPMEIAIMFWAFQQLYHRRNLQPLASIMDEEELESPLSMKNLFL
jgi:hypothetical protein